jgi:hypothetical protein
MKNRFNATALRVAQPSRLRGPSPEPSPRGGTPLEPAGEDACATISSSTGKCCYVFLTGIDDDNFVHRLLAQS